MANTNSSANTSFRGMSSGYSLYPSRKNNVIFRNVRLLQRTQIDNYLLVKKNLIVGGDVNKDMDHENYTQEFNPSDKQSILFPGMADFIEANILQGDKSSEDTLQATYWNDLGNDVFDDWGYFFIYDVSAGKYYFPLLTPMNQADKVMTTQTFNPGFGELSFNITHGWREKGIFQMDVSCTDSNFEFRFGAYGNLGSDGDEDDYNMTASYGTGKTLYYHHHAEQNDEFEVLYSYFQPYREVDNTSDIFASLYDPENTDDNSLITKPIKEGVRVYFSKQYDVKDWVISDILEEDLSLYNGDIKAEGNILAEGQILAKSFNLGRTGVIYLNNENYIAGSDLINGYFMSNGTSETRNFYLPNVSTLFSAIPNAVEGTSFRFTINNYQNIEGGHAWNLSFETSNLQGTYLKHTSVPAGCIITYAVILNFGEGPGGIVVQESEPVPYLP